MVHSTKKVKICIVMPGHWTDRMGGAQYQAACLIDALIATKKFEIYYISRNVDPAFRPQGYKIVTIRKPFGLIQRGFLYLDILPLLKTLKIIKPDVIYTRIGCAYTGIAAFYAQQNNCKLVWHISSDSNTTRSKLRFSRDIISRYIDRKLFEYGINHATHIIAQTEAQANKLKQYYGRDVTDIIANFHPLPKEKILKGDLIKIVWIANIKPVKQPGIFIELAKDFSNVSNIEFIMIGSIQGSSRWHGIITNKINSAQNLKYLGFIPQDRVNAILSESHILVNTSKWEGFTNTFIQAWMRKVPVVSLNVNPDNLFDNHMLGLYAGNYEMLKKCIDTLIHNTNLRHSMGEYAYQYSLQHYTEGNAQKIITILN